MQTIFSNSCESQAVSLHDTTGRLRSGKCYLRSFPHSAISTNAPNSISMSTAPQEDLFSSTQPQTVVCNVLTSVSSLPEILVFSSGPSVSTFEKLLASPAMCSTVGPADLPNMSRTATSEVPHFRAKLCFHDVSRSASPWRHRRPNHVILAPMLCADRTVTPRKQWLPCLVHTLFVLFFHSCLCFIFVFICYILHFRSMTSSAMQPYIILHFFPATFQRIHALSSVSISAWLPQTTMCTSATFLTLLSLLPFDSTFCSTEQNLAYCLTPHFFRIPATISLSPCLLGVDCSARHL